MKIQKGDKVKIITGKYKNTESTVLNVFRKKNSVLLQKVNVYKKHQKPDANQKGEIKEIIKPMHISNVMVIDPKSGKRSRIKYEKHNGSKVRVLSKTKSVLKKKNK